MGEPWNLTGGPQTARPEETPDMTIADLRR